MPTKPGTISLLLPGVVLLVIHALQSNLTLCQIKGLDDPGLFY